MPPPHPRSKHRRTAHRQPISDSAVVSLSADVLRNSTILLVDDDAAVLTALRRVLESEGWCVSCASSGEQALEYLQTHQPQLMITDLSMANVSGWDLLFHENLQRPELPVFVITALPLPATGGAETFADAFFQKPLDFDLLLSAVRRTLTAAGGDNAA